MSEDIYRTEMDMERKPVTVAQLIEKLKNMPQDMRVVAACTTNSTDAEPVIEEWGGEKYVVLWAEQP